MTAVPRGVHREVLRRGQAGGAEDEPVLYAIWDGVPHAEGSRLLGRAERLGRGRWWRAFPVTGEYPRVIRRFNVVIGWLMEVRDGHAATTDSVTATESESVRELLWPTTAAARPAGGT